MTTSNNNEHESHSETHGNTNVQHIPHVFDACGNQISTVFDESGNILSIFDASGHNLSNVYDASGHKLSSITDTSGNIFEITNDISRNSTVDISLNITTDDSCSITNMQSDVSWNTLIHASGTINVLDSSLVIIPIVSDLSSTTVHGSGYEIKTLHGTGADGSKINRVIFNTTDPSSDVQIYENLTESITTYNDETDPHSQTSILLNQIKSYAAEIQCTDFQGKGSIDDYTTLFQAASKIASDSKQMELNVDIEGFTDFGNAADQLSELFQGFIIKLQNVNIITDITFLTAISKALAKIVNLSNIFGKFKQAVFDTTTIQLPKSAHDTSLIIEDVMDEVNCAMQYINYFVDPTSNPTLGNAKLNATEKNIIAKSVDTINNWNTLCEYGVSIAMSSDVDVQNIQHASSQLKSSSVALKNAASTLRSKIAQFNITC